MPHAALLKSHAIEGSIASCTVTGGRTVHSRDVKQNGDVPVSMFHHVAVMKECERCPLHYGLCLHIWGSWVQVCTHAQLLIVGCRTQISVSERGCKFLSVHMQQGMGLLFSSFRKVKRVTDTHRTKCGMVVWTGRCIICISYLLQRPRTSKEILEELDKVSVNLGPLSSTVAYETCSLYLPTMMLILTQ